MGQNEQQLHLDLPGAVEAGGSAGFPGLVDAVAELVWAAGDGDGLSAFEADCRQAGLAAGLRLAAGEPSLIGDPVGGLAGSSAGGSDADAERSPFSIVDGLAALAGDGHPEPAVALRSLAIYGGSLRAAAAARLEALNLPAQSGPAPEVRAAHLLSIVPGDADELVLELVYPTDAAQPGAGAASPVGIAVVLDTFAGRRPLDVVLLDDIADFLDEATTGPVPARVEEMPVAEAISLLAHAFWLFDHTIGAADDLPDDSDLLLARPLLDRLVASHPHSDYDPVEVADESRAEAVQAFTRWLADQRPEIDVAAVDFVPLLVDFAADQADDPRRWSVRVAVEFLQMACHRVLAPADELAVLPDLVRLMIRWAHGEKEWPTDLTTTTLAAIDQVQPLFEAELDGSGQTEAGTGPEAELVEPPVGGTHPEPFDDRGIPGEIRGPVALIVAEATDRATELFDAEFVTPVRRLIADAARHRNSPLGRGKPTIWASAAVYAVAQLNEIPGGWSPLARPAAEITSALDGAPGTITNKARTLRALLDADHFPPEPRYQHSTTAASVGQMMSGIFGALAGSGPIGDLIGPSGLRLVGPPPTVEPGSVDAASVGADCFVLRIGLADVRPEIWRRVRVPVDASFAQLHRLLQLSFGWEGYHLHAFEFDSYRVGPTGGELGFHDPDSIDEEKLRLCDAVGPGSEFVYLYDFGDNWEHRIVVEAVEDLDASSDIATGEPLGPFALLGGAMAGPPEDCGGWPGYADILQSMRNRNHPGRAELAEWLPAGFDPKRFDAYTLNQFVQRHDWSR